MNRHGLAGLMACLLFTGLCVSAGEQAGATNGEKKIMALARTRQLISEKKPVRVVLYGDSISEVKKGWNGGAKSPEENWGALLVKRLNETYPGSTFTVQHFAIGGQNSYEGLGRLDGLEAFNPDLVLVAFGANDCCHHYLLPEETKLALTTLVTEIGNRFGADTVLVGTGGDNPLKPFFRHLEETREVQRQAAEETGVPFVDMRTAMRAATEEGKRWGEFHLNAENCHPNKAGHIVWAETAFTVIQNALK